MIVREEHVQAFKKAWADKQTEKLGKIRFEGEKTRAGLEAVFALLNGGYEEGWEKGWDEGYREGFAEAEEVYA